MKPTSIKTLTIIALLGACFFISCDSKEEYKEELSDQITLVTTGNSTKLVDNETGKTLIEDISVDWVQNGNDSLAVFAKDDKRGYFNVKTGEIVVPLKYKHAWIFSEGLAGVVQNDKVGFINTKGELVIPCRYPYRGNSLTSFVFKNGYCVVADSTQQLGVIDTLGNWALPPQYDAIHLAKEYAIVFNEGQLKKQIDFSGNILAEGLIDDVYDIHYSKSYTNTQTGVPVDVDVLNEDFKEYRVEGRSGLMNKKGKLITPPIYTDITGLTEELFCAQLQDWVTIVIINTKGEIIKY